MEDDNRLFSEDIEDRPEVQAWMRQLSEENIRELTFSKTPSFKEVPFESEKLEFVCDERQAVERAFADLLPSAGSPYEGELLQLVRKHMRRHWRSLTPRQKSLMTLHWEGLSIREIARRLRLPPSTVHQGLHGWLQSNGRLHGGAYPKLLTLLSSDAIFLTEVTRMEKRQKKLGLAQLALSWFRGLDPRHPERIGPLMVLFWLNLIADRKRELRFNDAYQLLPKSVINAAVTPLKFLGYVQSDGVTIKILKTPADGLATEDGDDE